MENAAPEPEIYREQLENVRRQLADCAEGTDILGSDLAQFAWAESGDRIACISWCAEGIFVELL